MVEFTACNPGEHYSAQQGSFEGPEKLLEIWFSPSPEMLQVNQHHYWSDDDAMGQSGLAPKPIWSEGQDEVSARTGLRLVPRRVWDDMLSIVKCTVLNVIQDNGVDAYVLSESSMFVYPHKLILKTCGTTTLLLALSRLLDIGRGYLGIESAYRLFYSRKAFMFPERQVGPHRSWEDEVTLLESFFDNGTAYKIGSEDTDHWHLYVTKPRGDVVRSLPPHVPVLYEQPAQSGYTTPGSSDSDDDLSPFGHGGHASRDQTVEILMTHLDPDTMKQFYHDATLCPSGIKGGRHVDRVTGIASLYPEAAVDSFLFEPCGYSSNGLWNGRYFTIHVTPEPDCSYASFETNIPVEESHNDHPGMSPMEALVAQVVDIFNPGAFTLTFFTSHHKEHHKHSQMVRAMSSMQGYERNERTLYELDGYDVMYGHYVKS